MKARYLILAVHDYYQQKLDDQRVGVVFRGDPTRSLREDDIWTLQYIDLMHLQLIVEALDTDASGFVTIQEVNQFTTSRPKEWR